MANRKFAQWLLSEIETRGLTYTEVARRGDVSRGRISQVIAGDNPGRSFCVGIAKAFNLPIELVLNKAGLSSSTPEESDAAQEITRIMAKLSVEDQRLLLDMARSLYDRKPERGTARTVPRTAG